MKTQRLNKSGMSTFSVGTQETASRAYISVHKAEINRSLSNLDTVPSLRFCTTAAVYPISSIRESGSYSPDSDNSSGLLSATANQPHA